MKKLNISNSIVLIISLGLLARIIALFFYGDAELKNEWSALLHNFKISGVYGYNVVINDYYAIPKFAELKEEVLPTAFMPPLYFFIIYFFDKLTNPLMNVTQLIIFFQIFLNLFSSIILYKIIKIYEDKFFSVLGCFVFTFFPLNIYAAVQISSITLQIFLIIYFLFFLIKIFKKTNNKYLLFFSFVSGLLILTRGEFFLFYILTLIYLLVFNKKKIKILLISSIICCITITPYLVRNYINFERIILTKSFGYNLLKGNNPNLIVEGDLKYIEQKFNREFLKIKSDNQYEMNLDNLYKEKAIENIKNNPIKYLKFYFMKVFAFIFIDINSSYPNYYNFFHIAPKILISLISLFGAILVIKEKKFFQFLSIFYFSNIFLFSIFFILPRYSLILLPIQLILSIPVLRRIKQKSFL